MGPPPSARQEPFLRLARASDRRKHNKQTNETSLMKQICNTIKSSALALLTLLLPGSLMATGKPIVVSIDDVPNGRPVIQVQGAPNGYALYTDIGIADPTIEDGADILLFDVDLAGLLPDWGGGRVVVPTAPNPLRLGVDIVWITHDPGIIQPGALVVGFDSAFPGTYYSTPDLIGNENLGLVTDNWVEVYTSDIVVIRYKPHTYRLRN